MCYVNNNIIMLRLYNKDVILRQLTAKIEELQETIQNLLENQNKEVIVGIYNFYMA